MKTGQILYLPAWGYDRGVHGSSRCRSRRDESVKWNAAERLQTSGRDSTHGSGECMGVEQCRMYCVHWNTLKARLARKSLADSRPATGRSWKPVLSKANRGTMSYTLRRSSVLTWAIVHISSSYFLNVFCLSWSLSPFRKAETSLSWGTRSSP